VRKIDSGNSSAALSKKSGYPPSATTNVEGHLTFEWRKMPSKKVELLAVI
jgi:hypothetical protein